VGDKKTSTDAVSFTNLIIVSFRCRQVTHFSFMVQLCFNRILQRITNKLSDMSSQGITEKLFVTIRPGHKLGRTVLYHSEKDLLLFFHVPLLGPTIAAV